MKKIILSFLTILSVAVISLPQSTFAKEKNTPKEKTKKNKKRKKNSGGGIESSMIFDQPNISTQVSDSVVEKTQETVENEIIDVAKTIMDTTTSIPEEVPEVTGTTNEAENITYELPAEHITGANENLYSIARKYNIPVASLILFNNLSSTEIKEGQKIILTEKTAAVSKENNLPSAPPSSTDNQTINENKSYAINITPEDIFIGCYAVAEEKAAIAKMHFLKEKGYNASYFFIPDYVLNGKKLYRVFAGPFSNFTNAKTALAEIQKFRAQAYIFRVK